MKLRGMMNSWRKMSSPWFTLLGYTNAAFAGANAPKPLPIISSSWEWSYTQPVSRCLRQHSPSLYSTTSISTPWSAKPQPTTSSANWSGLLQMHSPTLCQWVPSNIAIICHWVISLVTRIVIGSCYKSHTNGACCSPRNALGLAMTETRPQGLETSPCFAPLAHKQVSIWLMVGREILISELTVVVSTSLWADESKMAVPSELGSWWEL